MSAIVSQLEELEQNQAEFETILTTLINREGRKFPGAPITVVTPVHSIAQTSVKHFSSRAKSYYLPQRLQNLASMPVKPYQYQLRTIEEPSEEFNADDIAVHTLARRIARQNVGFVQVSAKGRCGKFLTSPTSDLLTSLPHSPSKLHDFEADEDEPVWRGVFPCSRTTKVLFSKEIDIKVDELPAWKPHIVIDSYRLEDDDE
ncbi:MAG: hypothetical protein F6K14_29315 [Symploca sp. SIO2C1]|nr:hypothetical protein [Symploca sp. SIO2C1]